MVLFIPTCFMMIVLLKVNAQLLSLNSPLQPNVPICPGPIEFTCVGTRVPLFLQWKLNDTVHGIYPFTGDTRPVSIILNPLVPGVMAQVTNVSPNEDGISMNITSTLSGNASALDGSSVQCTAGTFTSEIHMVTVIDISPPPSFTSCSLFLPPGGPGVSLQWNSSFNSQHAIELYHVTVTPNLSTCSRDVMPSEEYSCPGLALGTQYTFTVSTINCGDLEGMEYTFTVQPQVPQNLLTVEAEPFYDSSSRLSEVRVRWRNQPPSISERCDYDRTVNYTVFLVNSTGERVDQGTVSSDSCIEGLCSTSFSPSSSDQTYHVSVSATNVFGGSLSSTSSMTFNGSSAFSHSLTFDNCMTTLLCSYFLSEGQCFIQYGQDPSYQDLTPPIQGPLNSPFTLPLMDENIFYYYLVNNTFGIQFTGNFTTGEFAVRLTPANQVLLVVGVILLSIATIVGIVLIAVDVRTHKGSRLFLIMLVLGCVVVVLSIVLWVAVGFQVGLQKNTCDTNWQSTRNSLIFTAFDFSLLSTLYIIAAGVLFAIGYFCFKQGNEHKNDRKESWWHNLLTPQHITSTGSNKNDPKVWEVIEEEHKDKLTEGRGGRIIEMEEEDLATEGFRGIGEKYLDAKLRTQETIFQEYTAKKAEEESKEVYSVTQHNNTLQVKVDSNYSHLNRPGASMEGDSHYLLLKHDKRGSGARNKNNSTSTPQVGGRAGDSIQKRGVLGGEEYGVLNNKKPPSSGSCPGTETT